MCYLQKKKKKQILEKVIIMFYKLCHNLYLRFSYYIYFFQKTNTLNLQKNYYSIERLKEIKIIVKLYFIKIYIVKLIKFMNFFGSANKINFIYLYYFRFFFLFFF